MICVLQVYVRDATVVSPFALLLFGGFVEVHHLKGQCTLDGWLTFAVPAQVRTLCNCAAYVTCHTWIDTCARRDTLEHARASLSEIVVCSL
jgi:hypothetical protein